MDEMYTQVAEKWLAQQAEMMPLQRQFLEKALAFYQRLSTEIGAEPAVRFETANAEQRVGEIQQKLGRHAESEAAYRRANSHLKAFAHHFPAEPNTRRRAGPGRWGNYSHSRAGPARPSKNSVSP